MRSPKNTSAREGDRATAEDKRATPNWRDSAKPPRIKKGEYVQRSWEQEGADGKKEPRRPEPDPARPVRPAREGRRRRQQGDGVDQLIAGRRFHPLHGFRRNARIKRVRRISAKGHGHSPIHPG